MRRKKKGQGACDARPLRRDHKNNVALLGQITPQSQIANFWRRGFGLAPPCDRRDALGLRARS
jgi:hypothetical protein